MKRGRKPFFLLSKTALDRLFWRRANEAWRDEIFIISHRRPFCQAFFAKKSHKVDPRILCILYIAEIGLKWYNYFRVKEMEVISMTERLLQELLEFLEESRKASTGFCIGGFQSEYDMGKEAAYEDTLDFLNERLAKK